MSETDEIDFETLFERDEDREQTSQTDRLRRTIDLSVVAPLRIAMRDWRAVVAGLVLLLYAFMGTIGVQLAKKPTSGDYPFTEPPFQNLAYPLGTDLYGRSILDQIVHATPDMFRMIFAGAVFAVAVAAVVGLVSGFFRGSSIDTVLMMLSDIVITIPGLPLIIVITAIFQPKNPYVVGVFLGIDMWPGLARTVRSQVLSIREESYVEASRIMGLPTSSILRRDIAGQLMPFILVNASLTSRRVIFESVALYFLGVLPFTTYNWGVLMNLAYQANALTRPQLLPWLIFPMLTIILISFAFVLLSQAMDAIFNVRLQARHAKTIEADDAEVSEQ